MKLNKQKTVLVTGANGMLGPSVVKELAHKGFVVFAGFHNDASAIPRNPNVNLIKLDITSKQSISGIKKNIRQLDILIHCAALVDTKRCEENPREAWRLNVLGTRNMVVLAKNYSAKFIYLSTPMIFDGTAGNYKENDIQKPLNQYARTKALGESEAKKYKQSLIIRVNPLGVRPPHMHPSILQFLLAKAETNEPVTLFGDVRINPLSVKTTAKIMSRFVDTFKSGTWHIGSRKPGTILNLWREILKHYPDYHAKVDIKSVISMTDAKRPPKIWLNTDKIQKNGIKMPSFTSQIREAVEAAV